MLTTTDRYINSIFALAEQAWAEQFVIDQVPGAGIRNQQKRRLSARVGEFREQKLQVRLRRRWLTVWPSGSARD